MYSSSSHNVPIVTNSLFLGHGFKEKSNNSSQKPDDTVHTHQVFDYDDVNTTEYPYQGDSNEFTRLLSPSESNNNLIYSNDPSTSYSKLNELYRKNLGASVSYQNINTSYNQDSKPTEAYLSSDDEYKIFSFWDKFKYRSQKPASDFLERLLRFFMNLIVSVKNVFQQILIYAISFVLACYIIGCINKISDEGLDFFKEKPTKKITPPTIPKQLTTQPPPKPELTFEKVYFRDILGIEEAKEDVMEVVKFIKKPYLYKRVGAKIPKGILLVGPPGTGKTMLAKAVATETGIPFIYTSGPEFVEIYVGQGAQRIRSLFERARKIAPCIIFIDEIDAVGTKRASGSFSGQNREHDQTLNQLLVEMDGFNVSTGITILAATNRMSSLDKALLRPGRFDRVVHIPLPSLKGRIDILNHYLKGVKYDRKEVDVKDLGKITAGYSGADLKNLVNEAALITVKQDRQLVSLNDLYEARDKIMMGNKRNLIMPELERKMTAYHEAGHALVAFYLYPNTDPIHKATIITRGTALGFVEQLPDLEFDKSSYKLIEMKSRLAVCMAGKMAEKLVFGFDNVTSGASSDIVSATDLAYKMITQYGMSKKLPSLNFHNLNGMNNQLSSDLNSKIEEEIMQLIKSAEHMAESILRIHRSELELLAAELLKHETLTGEQIRTLINTKKPLPLAEKPFKEINVKKHKNNKNNSLQPDNNTNDDDNNKNNKKENNKENKKNKEVENEEKGNEPNSTGPN